jgi:hypothetical protein
VRICLDNDFDEGLISKELKKYETEDKYKNLAEYEWNKVTTKE